MVEEINNTTYKKRTRVKFDTSTKGVITPSCTVEMLDATNDEVMKEVIDLYSIAQANAKEMMNNV